MILLSSNTFSCTTLCKSNLLCSQDLIVCWKIKSQYKLVIEFRFSVIVIVQGINSPHSNSNQYPSTTCWNFVVKTIQVSSSECSWKKKQNVIQEWTVLFFMLHRPSHRQSKGIEITQLCEYSVASHECGPSANSAWCSMCVEFVVAWTQLAPRVFLWVLWFSSLCKNQHSKFQFDQERGPTWKPAKTDVADSVITNSVIFISYFLNFLFKQEKVVVANCGFKHY